MSDIKSILFLGVLILLMLVLFQRGCNSRIEKFQERRKEFKDERQERWQEFKEERQERRQDGRRFFRFRQGNI